MRWIVTACLCLLSAPALAHPHIFIDSGLRLIFDSQGRLAAVQVTWTYDDFYSLVQLQDMELDMDMDGVLTEAELAELAGFDTNWVEGYEGDFYLSADGQPVALSGPTKAGARVEDGRITTWHTRSLVHRYDPADGPLVMKIYDPTYYTAYTTELGVELAGRDGCEVTLVAADLGKAYDTVEELLNGPATDASAEANFPAVGELFADTLTLECAAGS